jgi:hypothetical protein
MLNVNHKTFANTSLALLSVLMMVNPVRGDDLTGLPPSDSKELLTVTAPRHQIAGLSFLPMPSWSRVGALAALPDQLKPMGSKASVLVAAAKLTPPKETPAASPAPAATASNPKTSSPAETSPAALIAVSPFLQWIKANPETAAAEARQQASAYHAPSTSAPTSPSGTASAGAPAAAPGIMEDPYWLPPLIDSADSGPRSVAGSAAIYETPQR